MFEFAALFTFNFSVIPLGVVSAIKKVLSFDFSLDVGVLDDNGSACFVGVLTDLCSCLSSILFRWHSLTMEAGTVPSMTEPAFAIVEDGVVTVAVLLLPVATETAAVTEVRLFSWATNEALCWY